MSVTDPPYKPEELKPGVLNAGSIALMVIAAAAPLSLIAGYGPIGFLVAGIGAPAGFLIAGIVMALFIVGVVAMTRYVARPGAFYLYVGQAFGRHAGTAAASLAIAAYLFVQIGGMGILSATTQTLLQVTAGVDVPWWVIGLTLTALMWIVCRRGVDIGVKLLLISLTAEVALLTFVSVAVISTVAPSQGLSLASFELGNVFVPGMAAAAVVWFGAYFGIESATLYRSESKNPAKSIPRATAISLSFLAVFYCFVAWAVSQAFNVPDLAAQIDEDPTAMLFIIADHYIGEWAGVTAQFLLVTSSLGSGIAYFNAISRYGHSMGVDGMLPRATTRVHPRYKTPLFGNFQALLTGVTVLFFGVAGLDPYRQLTVWLSSPGTLGIMGLMALTSLAAATFFTRRKDLRPRKRELIIGTSVLGSALLVAAIWSMISNIELLTGADDVLNLVVVMTPLVIFTTVFLASWLRSKRTPPAAEPATHPGQASVPAPEVH